MAFDAPQPRFALALASIVAFVIPLAARDAAACSVCLAGDPIFSTEGATSQESGSFSIYLEARSFSKSGGTGAHGDETTHPEAGARSTPPAAPPGDHEDEAE